MVKIDLRPTKKKIFYSLIISTLISIVFFVFQPIIKKSAIEYMAPEEFHFYYLIPILSFLITYFFVCWFITHKSDRNTLEQIK